VIEHVQDAGVHSGDAIMSIPTISITNAAKAKIRAYTKSIARELKARGPLNVQFLVKGRSVYVIECNLRASRSLPYVCKATGVNLIDVVAPAVLGGSLKRTSDVEAPKGFVVKAPQFSFLQIDGADPKLGVEMRSTGEVACFGGTFPEALSKALVAAGRRIPVKGDNGIMLLEEGHSADSLSDLVAEFAKAGLGVTTVMEGDRGEVIDDVLSRVSRGEVAFVLSFNSNSNKESEVLHRIRRKAVDLQVQVITTREEAEAVLLCVPGQAQPLAP
jgi:carbamoyl-phosphate synthase large subunit